MASNDILDELGYFLSWEKIDYMEIYRYFREKKIISISCTRGQKYYKLKDEPHKEEL